jgi:hypothetical protein
MRTVRSGTVPAQFGVYCATLYRIQYLRVPVPYQEYRTGFTGTVPVNVPVLVDWRITEQ